MRRGEGGGGGESRVQQLKMLPRADTKSHFWHPRADTIPHFDSPRVDK